MDDATLPRMSRAGDRESGLARNDKLELRLWLRLLTCTHLIEGRVRARLREHFATTLARFDLLAQLDRVQDGLGMGELSSRLMVSNGNVTGLAQRLIEEGLVARLPAGGDRRRTRLLLTAAGKRAFDAMTPDHERWIDGLFAGLTQAEMTQFLGLLARLKGSIHADPAPSNSGR